MKGVQGDYTPPFKVSEWYSDPIDKFTSYQILVVINMMQQWLSAYQGAVQSGEFDSVELEKISKRIINAHLELSSK